MKLKNLLPPMFRRSLQLSRRYFRDSLSATVFAQKAHEMPVFAHQFTIRQNILNADTNFGKVENMRLASQALSKVVIYPNEVLSFWRIVGNPSERRGFQRSRNLVGGVLREDFGGGLCQVSGILYLTALSVGLKIVERHSHSVDIYAENERFAPLGADATVVFGYKDVRIQNTLNQPICFHLSVEKGQLVCKLLSQHSRNNRDEPPLSIFDLDFERTDFSTKRVVTTRIRASEAVDWQVLGQSVYRLI